MNRKLIQQTLTKALSDWAISENIELYTQNQSYEPAIGHPHIRQWFIDGISVNTTLSDTYERYIGIMQIDIVIPYDTGEGLVFDLYESLKLIFKTNGKIRNKHGFVQLGKVYLSGQQSETPWYTRYVTIEYSAFSDN